MHDLEEKAQKALDLIIALEDAEEDQFKRLVMGQIGKELLAESHFWHRLPGLVYLFARHVGIVACGEPPRVPQLFRGGGRLIETKEPIASRRSADEQGPTLAVHQCGA